MHENWQIYKKYIQINVNKFGVMQLSFVRHTIRRTQGKVHHGRVIYHKILTQGSIRIVQMSVATCRSRCINVTHMTLIQQAYIPIVPVVSACTTYAIFLSSVIQNTCN